MTLPEIKNLYLRKLNHLYPETEILSFFYLLLEHFYGSKKVDLALEPQLLRKEWPKEIFMEALDELLEEKPIQHIIGKAEFAGMQFDVDDKVLIPRPETEELVLWITKSVDKAQTIKILDIGTGSGCIAIALAKKLPQAEVYALDISAHALDIAKKNAKKLEARVRFFRFDVLEEINLTDTFDVIVSNPPYVRFSEKKEMRGNVLKHEPDLALFVKDEDPLLFYRKIASLGMEALSEKGMLFFEINENLAQLTEELLWSHSYDRIEIKKDIYGKNRMIRAFKK